jgi:hypothetical protein
MYDDKLDTGMKASEAIERASKWWDATGRHVMRKDGLKGSDHGASMDPNSPNYIPSGILNGIVWDGLTKDEKHKVVKAWHHEFVRKPQTIPVIN